MTDRSPAAPHTAATQGEGDHDVTTRYFHVRGTVQNVMFRQTVIRAMIKRELTGGATNDKSDKKLVHLTLQGSEQTIDELMDAIKSGKQLNDWGATATSVMEIEKSQGKRLTTHQVTTANVDTKQWNPNCTMFI